MFFDASSLNISPSHSMSFETTLLSTAYISQLLVFHGNYVPVSRAVSETFSVKCGRDL